MKQKPSKTKVIRKQYKDKKQKSTGIIACTDPDKEQNGQITYGIEGTNFSEVLYANMDTGDIIAKKALEETLEFIDQSFAGQVTMA